MHGFGLYWLPDGTIYEGDMKNGAFDSYGTLTLPTGNIIKGFWENGKSVKMSLEFSDGLAFCENNWKYCNGKVRR